MRATVGTSGWVYADWRGSFYPRGVPQRAWLGWFAERFPTVEVNASFYRLPTPGTFERWREETPDGFTFAVKASRYVTHVRRLRDAAQPVATLWERASLLGGKLGPVLFQLPPGFAVELELLRAFLGVLPRGMLPAFEFRDASWDAPEVLSALDAAGAAWVLADRPGARSPSHVTGGWSYVRFHQGTRAASGYPLPKLRRWADLLAALPADRVFAYFNNDTGGAAIRDARTLMRLLEERQVSVDAAQNSER
ncbi:MAG: DUF72 domain-containing protein [Planctomycetaceae bacterium]